MYRDVISRSKWGGEPDYKVTVQSSHNAQRGKKWAIGMVWVNWGWSWSPRLIRSLSIANDFLDKRSFATNNNFAAVDIKAGCAWRQGKRLNVVWKAADMLIFKLCLSSISAMKNFEWDIVSQNISTIPCSSVSSTDKNFFRQTHIGKLHWRLECA